MSGIQKQFSPKSEKRLDWILTVKFASDHFHPITPYIVVVLIIIPSLTRRTLRLSEVFQLLRDVRRWSTNDKITLLII